MRTPNQTHTLFESAEWLDAVAPGCWDAVTVEEGGRVLARLPFVVKARAGVRVLTVPRLTPWLGPWIDKNPGKYRTQLAQEHELLHQLICKLPRVDAAVLPAAPEQLNMLPFHWDGFDLKLGYTYRISLNGPLEGIWQEAKQELRKTVRKAAQKLAVDLSGDIDDVERLLAATYRRQELPPPPVVKTIGRIMNSPSLQSHHELLIARDEAGKAHAFALLAFDSRHTFYVLGGADPLLRASGAQTLLLWTAIERAYGRSAQFDFEGSMTRGIERAFRSFGAVQTPQVTAMRYRTILGKIYRTYTKLKVFRVS